MAHRAVVFAALSRLFGREKARLEGRRIHAHTLRNGFLPNARLCHVLVQMYSNSGAPALFETFNPRNPALWNLRICQCAPLGQINKALLFFEQMQREGFVPEKLCFPSILSACAAKVALAEGKQLHAYISKIGYESDVVVGTALVNMYGKCGCLDDAWRIFTQIDERDAFLWTAMIASHAQHGSGMDALKFFEQMHLQGVLPDKVTYVSVFSACASEEALVDGRRLHACVEGTRYISDVIIGNALVNMYGKCASLGDAQMLFDRMPERDIVSWNAILAGCAHNGQGKDTLQFFEQMQMEGVLPNKFTVSSVFDACASQAALFKGKSLHTCIIGSGLETDVIVGTALVNMYAKCGSIDDAKTMFDRIPDQDVVLWNAMLAAYIHNGQTLKALQVFIQMLGKGIFPNKVTYISILDAYASKTVVVEGMQIHILISSNGFLSDITVGNALVNMYSRCGSLEHARRVFQQMTKRNIVSWNAMIAACALHDQGKDALQMFEQMQQLEITPDKLTIISVLDACASQAALAEGRLMHMYIVVSPLAVDIILGTHLTNLYGKCGSVEDAWIVFRKMSVRDTIAWTAMITASEKVGRSKDALQLFNQMQQEGVIPDKIAIASILSACTCHAALEEGLRMHTRIAGSDFELVIEVVNALVCMYGTCGKWKDAMRIFNAVPEHDNLTFISILSACASHAALTEGKQVHASILASEFELNVYVGNALVNMYAKCGSVEDAQLVFDKMSDRDVVTWTVVITAYALQGEGEKIILLFEQMQQEGVLPNVVTFVAILTACSHAGLVREGSHYFMAMDQLFGMAPMLDHYNCMVDLLGRAGSLDEAEDLISNMPFHPNNLSWTILVGACKSKGDVDRAVHATKHAVELEPEDAVSSVMLSNIHAAAGRGIDIANVVDRLGDKVLGQTGSTLIGIMDTVHVSLFNDEHS